LARRRLPTQRKLRTREHIIADLAVNHVERQVFLCGWTVERVFHDYGLDLILFFFNSMGELENGNAYIQVKATERATVLRTGQAQ
jgi:hypothetical protein